LPIYETEVVENNLDPKWEIFSLSDQKLCNGEKGRNIRIECWDYSRSHQYTLIGYTVFTLENLLQGQREFKLLHPERNDSGVLKLETFLIMSIPSFMDYIRGGLQLNLILAIDYSISNNSAK
jgi:Ca2+-dependent lipid-binding protein